MDTAQYKLLLDAAQVGWWEIDFEKKCYICSDYLVSLLDLDGKTIPAEDFLGLIREDYRARIANELGDLSIGRYTSYWNMSQDL